MAKVPGSIITDFELKNDDGRHIYEVKAVLGQMEYEFEINALTGDILKFETDKDDQDMDEEDEEDEDDQGNIRDSKDDDCDKIAEYGNFDKEDGDDD